MPRRQPSGFRGSVARVPLEGRARQCCAQRQMLLGCAVSRGFAASQLVAAQGVGMQDTSSRTSLAGRYEREEARIKIHGEEGFAGMRRAGRLAAETLDF